MIGRVVTLVLFIAIGALADRCAWCQQVTTGVPFSTAGHSFHEQIGVNWGVRGNGWFFNFGGAPAPPFGGFDPNGGARLGFMQPGFTGPNGFFNLTASQGSTTTFGGQSASVTMPNGGTGGMFDQTIRPFVTGVIPVVGDLPPAGPSSVLEERLMRLSAGEGSEETQREPAARGSGAPAAQSPSSAERGELGVAEIKARKAAGSATEKSATASQIEALLEKARGAIAAGKPGVARIHLQMAARRAEGDERAAIHKWLEELDARDK